jgi:hypothetical protein
MSTADVGIKGDVKVKVEAEVQVKKQEELGNVMVSAVASV